MPEWKWIHPELCLATGFRPLAAFEGNVCFPEDWLTRVEATNSPWKIIQSLTLYTQSKRSEQRAGKESPKRMRTANYCLAAKPPKQPSQTGRWYDADKPLARPARAASIAALQSITAPDTEYNDFIQMVAFHFSNDFMRVHTHASKGTSPNTTQGSIHPCTSIWKLPHCRQQCDNRVWERIEKRTPTKLFLHNNESSNCRSRMKLGNRKGGGQNVSCDFGGGGERTIECPLQNHRFLCFRKWDLSGLRPFPPKKMTWHEQRGGGNVS